ncbi:MAG TPA: glycogen debranching enzyme, partial [Nocardioidaceae bacterium]
TAHDGFTMRDLVSYNEKHNEANGEGGADGESHNRSWNCGVEGDTDDPEILALRARQQRNFLATLLLSQGVPMIAHGDELGRGQRGNNNVYCQDNELSWVDWKLEDWQEELLAFTRRVVALRHEQPVFRRRRFLAGTTDAEGRPEVGWYKHTGQRMTDTDWNESHALSMMVFLNGEAIPEPDPRGERVVGDSFLVAFNAYRESIPFRIPEGLYDDGWIVALDTSDDQIGIVSVFDDAPMLVPGVEFPITGRSVVVLRRAAGGETPA